MGRIVAVAGPPGSGKTTVATAVAKQLGAGVVAWDNYETMTQQGPEVMVDWLKRGSPYGEIDAPGLLPALQAARERGMVIFDMPLGRAYQPTATLIDCVVWLDAPPDICLARKILQLMPAPRSGQDASFSSWLQGYLRAYPGIVAPSLEHQRTKVRGHADHIVLSDGDVGTTLKNVLRVISRAT